MSNKKLGCGCLSTIILSTALLITGSYAFSKGWHQFIWGTKLTPLSAAEVIPQDVVITSYVNTNSEDWSKLEVPEVNQIVTQLAQKFKQSLPVHVQDLNYQRDLSPWLGNAAIAWFPQIVPSIDNNYGIKPDADFLLILGIKNPLKAYQFRQQLKSTNKIQYHESKFKGITVTTYQQSPTKKLYLAVLGNKLVISEKLHIMHQAIATFQGESALANKPEYKNVLRQKLDLKNSLVQVYITNSQSSSEATFPIESVALGIGTEAKAIQIKTMVNLAQDLDWQLKNRKQELVLEKFPQSTVALFSGQINTQKISHAWSYLLEDYYPYLPWIIDSKYHLDQWLKIISNYQDFFQLIDGEFALGITLAETNPNHNPELNLGAGLILPISDRNLADLALKKLERQSILSLLFPREDFPRHLNSAYSGLSQHWITEDHLLLTWNNEKELILDQSDNSIFDNPKFSSFYEELPRKNLAYFFLDIDAITAKSKNIYQPEKMNTELFLINSLENISSNSRMQNINQTIESDFLLKFK